MPSFRSRGPDESKRAAQVRSAGRRIPFRADIEGMRGVALILVLLAHGGVPLGAGGYIGLDMFYVISGFLITGLLVAEAEGSGSVALVRFYAQRIKRLLPLAALVLIVTAIGSILLFAPPQRELVSGDLVASALYVVNWQFAAQSVDYFGPETAASPVLHYWSLSIEEQFYLVWALVLVGVTWWSRHSGFGIRPLLIGVVGVIGVLSLLYSALYSPEEPNAAYFSTLTRAWEIALGAMLALIPLRRPSPLRAWLLTLAGIFAIGYSLLSYDATTIYPGTAALVPVLGVTALIVAGLGAARSAPQRLLETAPAVYLGGISYAWYLWHYPVMIFGIAAWGPLEYTETTLLVFAAGVPAIISHHLVGQPLRYSKTLTRFPRRAVAVGAACTVGAVAAAGALTATTPSLASAPEHEVTGAAELSRPRLQGSAEAVRPAPTADDARGDRGAVWEHGCMLQPPETRSGECVFGNPAGRRTAVLFGDSHAMHFFGTVERLARQRNWRLVALNKAGCAPYDATLYNGKVGREYDECRRWQERSLERIEREERPAIVFTAGAITHRAMEDGERLDGETNVAALEQGYVRMLERLAATGARVVALKDLPRAPHDMTDCVAENLDRLRECSFGTDEVEADHFEVRAAARVDGVELVDLSPALCSRGTCYGVIRNALTYRDDDHMTATFARTVAPWLARELDR